MKRRLVFRCGKCRQTTSTVAEWAEKKAASVVCSTCRSTYALTFDAARDPSQTTYYDRIKRTAAANRLDLATACSVVEGIMTLREARSPGRVTAAKGSQGPSRPSRLAVGVVTGLSIALAVIFWRAGSGPRDADGAARSIPAVAQPLRAAHGPERTAAPTPPPDPIAFRVDASGRLTEVSGPDPRSTMAAYCGRAQNGELLTPLWIASARPPSPGSRLGILRSLAEPDRFQVVRVWRDTRTGRWSIGNGTDPIPVERIASLPPGTDMVPF